METIVREKGGISGAMHRRIRGLILGIAVIMAVPVAMADELNLLLNGHAKHINAPKTTHYNERNTGFGLQYDFERADKWVPFLTASGFKDSEYNMSYYAGGGIQYRFEVAPSLDEMHMDLGVVAFFMTRKNFHNDQPFFGALPALTVGTRHVSLNITYIPRVDPKMVALWFFQLKVPVASF